MFRITNTRPVIITALVTFSPFPVGGGDLTPAHPAHEPHMVARRHAYEPATSGDGQMRPR